MNIQKIENPTHEMPATDELYQADDKYIRVRTLRRTTKETLTTSVTEPGCPNSITITMQCSLADETGDVHEDDELGHVILSKECHSIDVLNLNGDETIETWLTRVREKAISNAYSRAVVLQWLNSTGISPES